MSEFDSPSDFPDIQAIIQWSIDCKRGLNCGIFGCREKVAIECQICGGGYCADHKGWHFHSTDYNGILIK